MRKVTTVTTEILLEQSHKVVIERSGLAVRIRVFERYTDGRDVENRQASVELDSGAVDDVIRALGGKP